MILRQIFRPRRIVVILCVIGFAWCVFLINLSILGSVESDGSPEEMREEILRLSEKYVRSLAHETRDVVDGPYAGRLTGYDLKKTMAVLLENLLDRVDKLESKLDKMHNSSSDAALIPRVNANVSASQTLPAPVATEKPVHAKDLLAGAQEDCSLTVDQTSNYPHCKGKMDWMNSFWKSDKCYAENGVDGTMCSFRYYLSEVESWCPRLPNRLPLSSTTASRKLAEAVVNSDLNGLLDLLKDPSPRNNYQWIRQRIERTWPYWLQAAQNLTAVSPYNRVFKSRHKKQILVHLGLLSDKSGFRIPELASKGGPLGELVQWSDIISSLYILGHQLTITSEVDQLSMNLDKFPNAESQCQTRGRLPLDMIFTDIVGLIQFKRKVRNGYGKFSCILRIIDSFGTEAAFNNDGYAKTHHLKTQWGMQNLNLQQFFTMFPHSPDNSFMGFVVERHINSSSVAKKNQAVVYGKVENMWNGMESYLSVIKRHVEVHATVFLETGKSSVVPDYVINHGIMSGPDLHQLLQESKLFIGLGFPYEGPAPLEAIAQGCVFINPKFNPPHNAHNTKFFAGKPTLRQVTSQHPYAEVFIDEPHVFSVDINNATEVDAAVRSALAAIDKGQVTEYLPNEFTHEGMLLRITAYMQHQDFCSPQPEVWPPLSAVNNVSSRPGQSCKDACWEKKLICEPSHLKRLNSRQSVEEFMKATGINGGSCASVEEKDDIYFPGFETPSGRCYLQKDATLYSCVGEVEGLIRICSCRDFIRGQTALCRDCL